jgi:lysozyme
VAEVTLLALVMAIMSTGVPAEHKMSKAGLEETKSFEGFARRPYKDSGGTWTVGYGETDPKIVHSAWVLPMTERRASRLLKRRIDRDYGSYVNAMHLPLTQGMYDALADLAYNKGPGTIREDTALGRALRKHHWRNAAGHILDYNKDRTGTVLKGLVRRREANCKRFLADLP